MDEAYGIFDDYLETHAMTDFIPEIIEIYRVSGIIRSGETAEKN
jgi:hypothetical protein